MKRLLEAFGILSVISVMIFFCVVFPEYIGNSIKEAVDKCLYIIIPSLFMFLCLTSFISKSDLHSFCSMPLKKISEKIFHMPPEGLAVFLLSMISGYPAGIKLVSDNFQRKKLTAEQAHILNNVCFFSGPAFISGTAAAFLYPDSNAGLLLFLSNITGGIFCFFIYTRKLTKIKNSVYKKAEINPNQIVSSVKSSSEAIMSMCMMIVAFSGICSILRLSGIIDFIVFYTSGIFNVSKDITESIVMSLLEITNIISFPPVKTELFPIIAFLLSFGGVCVHLQIIALSDKGFSYKSFFVSRLLSALISSAAAFFLKDFLNIDTSCWQNVRVVSEGEFSPLPSVALVIMIILLIKSFPADSKQKV